jgi:hypothetical protein
MTVSLAAPAVLASPVVAPAVSVAPCARPAAPLPGALVAVAVVIVPVTATAAAAAVAATATAAAIAPATAAAAAAAAAAADAAAAVVVCGRAGNDNGASCHWVPVPFRPGQAGEDSVSFRIVVRAGAGVQAARLPDLLSPVPVEDPPEPVSESLITPVRVECGDRAVVHVRVRQRVESLLAEVTQGGD